MSVCYILEVKKMTSPTNWINHYPEDITIGFPNTYLLVSDFPVDRAIGPYTAFEQLRTDDMRVTTVNLSFYHHERKADKIYFHKG